MNKFRSYTVSTIHFVSAPPPFRPGVIHLRSLLSNTNPTSFATTNPSSPKNPNLPNRTSQIPTPQKCRSSTYRITFAR